MSKGNFFLTSDLHFGHKKLLEEYEPIRQTIISESSKTLLQDFEVELIHRWNSVVQKNDIVVVCGDFAINKFSKEITQSVIKINTQYLNGRKVLIRGNHDCLPVSDYLSYGWEMIIECPHILITSPYERLNDCYNFLCGCIILEHNQKTVLISHLPLSDAKDYRLEEEKKYLSKLYEKYNCQYQIYGHTHSRKIPKSNMESVCVEQRNFYPVFVQDIINQW